MKKYFYSLAMLTSIVIWVISVYLLLAKAPNVGPFQVPLHGAHTFMFFCLAFMTTCSQQKPKVFLTLAVLYLFGAATEVAQHFNPPRTCDPFDFAEDVIGATLGLLAALLFVRTIKRLFLNTEHKMKSKKMKNAGQT